VRRGSTTAQVGTYRAVRLSRPPLMEGEPARVPGSVAKGCAGSTVAFESPALLRGRWNHQVVVPGWKAGGGEGPVDRVHRLPPWRV